MAKTIEEFKAFLSKTGYKCAKKGDEYILSRDTSDPGVIFVSPEEYFSKGKDVKPVDVKPVEKKAVESVDVDGMTLKQLKAYAKENDISFVKNIRKTKLLEKIKKSL